MSAMPPRRSSPRVSALALLPAMATLLIAPATPASAQLLPINSCVLLPVTPGTLAPSAEGTELSSSGLGGIRATMNVTATGQRPTIRVAAPQFSGPAASLSGATTSIGYASLGGASQPHVTGPSVFSPAGLTDVVTFDARATNPAGFRAGFYSISITVTCEM